jgi:hypothetical protein
VRLADFGCNRFQSFRRSHIALVEENIGR